MYAYYGIRRAAPAEEEGADPSCRLRAPALHERIRRAFGRVRVGNRGEPFRWRPAIGRSGGMRAHSEGMGEIYRFNCPHCADSRFRGWAGHCYGQPDPVSGRPMTALVGCFNEDCFRIVPSRRDDFLLAILGAAGSGAALPPCPPGEVARPGGPVSLPGVTVSLSELDDSHPARSYVRGRGFDPDALAAEYGLGYCADADDDHEGYAINRLIIPLVRGGKLSGWQARKIREGGRAKRYYNSATTFKSGYLYGMDASLAGRLVVIVEGVPSVWSMGPPAVASLGSRLDQAQVDTLGPIAGRGGLVAVMFDPGAEGKAADACRALGARFPGRVVPVALPASVAPEDCRRWPIPKVDPGELRREAAWGIVAAAVAAAGFRIEDFLL